MKNAKKKNLSFPEDKGNSFGDLLDEITSTPTSTPKAARQKGKRGGGKGNQRKKNEPATKNKKDTILRSFYVSPEMVRDLKDIVYQKERNGRAPYTQKDALREAIALLKKSQKRIKRSSTQR